MCNVPANAGRSGRRVVSAFVVTAFAQDDAEKASRQRRLVADQFRPKVPKLAALMDEADHDVLTTMSFPQQHRTELQSKCADGMGHDAQERKLPSSGNRCVSEQLPG